MSFVFSYQLSTTDAINIVTKACSKFEFSEELIPLILQHYTEKGRAYHDIKHIASMLNNQELLPKHRESKELTLAILFHDIIILPKPTSKLSIEALSGQLAQNFLTKYDVNLARNVSMLVTLTNYNINKIGFILNNKVADYIRMLDLVELYHKESVVHNTKRLEQEALNYYNITIEEFQTKRKAFLKSLPKVIPFTAEFEAILPFTPQLPNN